MSRVGVKQVDSTERGIESAGTNGDHVAENVDARTKIIATNVAVRSQPEQLLSSFYIENVSCAKIRTATGSADHRDVTINGHVKSKFVAAVRIVRLQFAKLTARGGVKYVD